MYRYSQVRSGATITVEHLTRDYVNMGFGPLRDAAGNLRPQKGSCRLVSFPTPSREAELVGPRGETYL